MLKKHSMYDLDKDTKYAVLLLDVSMNDSNALIFNDEDELMDMLINSTLWSRHSSANTIMANLPANRINEYLINAQNVGDTLNTQYGTTVFASGNFEEVYRNASWSDLQILDGGFKQGYITFIEKNLILNTTNAGYYFNKLFNMNSSVVSEKKSLAECLNSKAFMSKVYGNEKLIKLLQDYRSVVLSNVNLMTKTTQTLTGSGTYTLPDDVFFIYFELNASGGETAKTASTTGVHYAYQKGCEVSAFTNGANTPTYSYSYTTYSGGGSSRPGSEIRDYLFLGANQALTYNISSAQATSTSGSSVTSTLSVAGFSYKCYGGGQGQANTYNSNKAATAYCANYGSVTYYHVWWDTGASGSFASSPVISNNSLMGNYCTYNKTGGSAVNSSGNLILNLYSCTAD